MTNQQKSYFEGKDMFLLPDGSTYHLGAKPENIPQRILTVGARSRAARIAKLLDSSVEEVHTSRDFSIFHGKYKGVDLAVISIGMGSPMMDFMVREASFVQPKPLAIIRLGTCGIINESLAPGTIMLSGKGACYCQVDYTYFYGNALNHQKSSQPFLISKPTPCSTELNALMKEQLKAANIPAHDGLTISCETFYACQGRRLEDFQDHNEALLDSFKSLKIDSIEMESHQLFHQANVRKTPCHVAAAAIGILNRCSSEFPNLSESRLNQLETDAARACLNALIQFQV